MPQSLANMLVHLVFSTKDRRPLLRDATNRAAMHRYLAGVSARLHCPLIAVGGVEDHVHLLGRQGRTIALADWVKELKRASSLWAKNEQFPHLSMASGIWGLLGQPVTVA